MAERAEEPIGGCRCWETDDPLFILYRDEWGVPVRDDRLLFEQLVLSGFQAGLSWRTILYKRENFRRAFHNFDVDRVAAYGARERRRLLADAGIIRNRQKIDSAINNAKAVLTVREEFGSLSDYLWDFVGGRPIRRRHPGGQSPDRSPESDALSNDLQSRGFSFVGTTIVYAFMQSVGLVNDHTRSCPVARAK
ncbi:MAG: DNA-3-methyladenine glycosylase I [Nitrospirota bacterium]